MLIIIKTNFLKLILKCSKFKALIFEIKKNIYKLLTIFTKI